MKTRIRELIVVEGRHDSENLKKYYDCDTIETGGTGFTEETIELIRRAQAKRGVIIFTDPDSPGNRIRSALNQAVPGCANAFVAKQEARTAKKVGVEHAGYEVLKEALEHLLTVQDTAQERIRAEDMYELGLSGQKDSAARREKLGKALHIGFGNARTMRSRLNVLCIEKEEIRKILETL